MARKTKTTEQMWSIYNPAIGFYTGAQLTRQEMIAAHTHDQGKTWAECVENGDQAVKVTITFEVT